MRLLKKRINPTSLKKSRTLFYISGLYKRSGNNAHARRLRTIADSLEEVVRMKPSIRTMDRACRPGRRSKRGNPIHVMRLDVESPTVAEEHRARYLFLDRF
jgi:hypothetical protein